MPDFDTRQPQEPDEPNGLRSRSLTNRVRNSLIATRLRTLLIGGGVLLFVVAVPVGLLIYSPSWLGQAISPAEKHETQGGVEETQPKTATDECLGEHRYFGDLNYSPAGEKIAFVSYYHYETYDSAPPTSAPVSKPGETDSELCVVNADGTGAVNLTDNSDEEKYATWSPDGTKIAFARGSNADYDDIFVMNADGSDETKLLDSDFANANIVNGLTWSPDGQKIAFGANAEIYIMRADGSSTPKTLTSDPALPGVLFPAWSPDGKSIAFSSPNGIYVMNTLGEGDTPQWQQLPNGTGSESYLAWSPDGTEIAFNRYEQAPGDAKFRPQTWMIYKVHIAGSKATRLVEGRYPTWAPDGNYIAYVTQDGGGIYMMDPDGSVQILVVGDAPDAP